MYSRPYRLSETPRPRRVWMNAVTLIERIHRRDTLEKKGQKHGPVPFRQLGKHLSKLGRISGAEVGRRLHAHEYNSHVGRCRPHAVDDGLNVRTHGIDREAAQAIVRARLQNEDVDGLAREPVDSTKCTGRGFAAVAGVVDAIRKVQGIDSA